MFGKLLKTVADVRVNFRGISQSFRQVFRYHSPILLDFTRFSKFWKLKYDQVVFITIAKKRSSIIR